MTEPIFVVGSLHSGANWAHDVLAAHPSVAGIKDPWTLYDERQTVERVRAAGEVLFGGRDSDLLAVRSVPSIFMIDELAEAWPGSRFIHVLRDGREAVVRVQMGRDNVDERTAYLFGTKIRDAARAWALATDAGLDAEAKLGDRIKTIRYEQVVTDRSRAAMDLLAYCGIDNDDSTVEKILELDDGRLKRPEPVDSWRAYYSVYRALKFHRAAWDTLRRTGYERDPKWWWAPIKR